MASRSLDCYLYVTSIEPLIERLIDAEEGNQGFCQSIDGNIYCILRTKLDEVDLHIKG